MFANGKGEILDYEGLSMAGGTGGSFVSPSPDDLIELPEGSDLFVLPDRLPIGIEPDTGEPALLDENPYEPGDKAFAVAAFMAPAHTAVYSTAYHTVQENIKILPLFAYTAVGWLAGKFWVAGFRSDADCRQDIGNFNQREIKNKTLKKLKAKPHNRLIQHLGKCCLTYGCPAARNYFLGRWEAPLPTSPICNAACIGCISLQPSGCCPATQDRIQFVPKPIEIEEIAVPHLEEAERAIVSFGQGCEGEPLLQADTIEASIKRIRAKTSKGTINLNTNAGISSAVKKLSDAGLDSIRISMNSARLEFHSRYYQPKGFTLDNVKQSAGIMKEAGKHVSLNYFILPGFTDDPDEFAALCAFIDTCNPDLIQLRNLNMDPLHYLRCLKHNSDKKTMGIQVWLRELRARYPHLRFGYFNPPLR